MKRILITGGAGFIGSHLARALVRDGHDVRTLDSLDPQVHGSGARPLPLPDKVEQVRGDVKDPATVKRALVGVDAVYHFAATVGVGQSMYEIRRYVENNSLGTAVLLEALAERPLDRLVVASSMSVYGEGLYVNSRNENVVNARREAARTRTGGFEVLGKDGAPLAPVPTPEWKTPDLASVYALTKFDQERLSLLLGAAYNIPTVALRFFNVYGPGQTLGNPYTGVLAIFATRILNGKSPLVFEDGRQQRDFVHVDDIVQACRLAMDAPAAVGECINVGSGQPIDILTLGRRIVKTMGREDLEPEVTGRARTGDVRHCFADITLARRLLGYDPQVRLEEGLRAMKGWLEQQMAEDKSEAHVTLLRERGLMA
jgi:dTDP-L-rhamnose 4-epimerase